MYFGKSREKVEVIQRNIASENNIDLLFFNCENIVSSLLCIKYNSITMNDSILYNTAYAVTSVKAKQCRRCQTSLLNRIYNSHAQKCQNIEAGDTGMIIAEM